MSAINKPRKPKDKFEETVTRHPYFIYDVFTQQEFGMDGMLACGTSDQLQEIIMNHLGGDVLRFEIRRNG
jgi:hypothetical protein